MAGSRDRQLLGDHDLMPTADVREVAAAMLYRQFDVPADALTARILPEPDSGKGSQFLQV